MTVNNHRETMWKKAVVAYFRALPRHSPKGSAGNYTKRQSVQSVSGTRIETST